MTLLPRLAAPVEVPAASGATVRRFAAPPPVRRVGLLWRRSSPRADEFRLLGEIVREQVAAALATRPR